MYSHHFTSKPQHAVLPLIADHIALMRDQRWLLQNIDLTIDYGGKVSAMMGYNGAGKSLLLRVLAHLIMPTSGVLTWGGMAPKRAYASRIGVVLQQPAMFRRSVRGNLLLALAAAGVARRLRADHVDELLTTSGLLTCADKPAYVLSAGEKQRLAIARALATSPDVLLLDEPTAALDPAATLAIERLITRVRKRNIRQLLITHDIPQARRLADDVIFLHAGKILEHAPAAAFFSAPTSTAAAMFLDGCIEDTLLISNAQWKKF